MASTQIQSSVVPQLRCAPNTKQHTSSTLISIARCQTFTNEERVIRRACLDVDLHVGFVCLVLAAATKDRTLDS